MNPQREHCQRYGQNLHGNFGSPLNQQTQQPPRLLNTLCSPMTLAQTPAPPETQLQTQQPHYRQLWQVPSDIQHQQQFFTDNSLSNRPLRMTTCQPDPSEGQQLQPLMGTSMLAPSHEAQQFYTTSQLALPGATSQYASSTSNYELVVPDANMYGYTAHVNQPYPGPPTFVQPACHSSYPISSAEQWRERVLTPNPLNAPPQNASNNYDSQHVHFEDLSERSDEDVESGEDVDDGDNETEKRNSSDAKQANRRVIVSKVLRRKEMGRKR